VGQFALQEWQDARAQRKSALLRVCAFAALATGLPPLATAAAVAAPGFGPPAAAPITPAGFGTFKGGVIALGPSIGGRAAFDHPVTPPPPPPPPPAAQVIVPWLNGLAKVADNEQGDDVNVVLNLSELSPNDDDDLVDAGVTSGSDASAWDVGSIEPHP
jgi:hypothetical protein